MWVELQRGLFVNPPPGGEGIRLIPFETPLTAADGMVLLVGAQCHLEDEAANVGKRPGMLMSRDIEELGELMSVSGECQSAMYRIRKEQLDAYLKPTRTIGGPLP